MTQRHARRRDPRTCAAALALACIAIAAPAGAQVQRSFINASFEQPALATPGCRVYIADAQVPGYTTSHPAQATENVGGCVVPGGFAQTAPIIELWRTPRDNASGGVVNAPAGVQIAELNAAVASRIFQNVCLINNERIHWRFHHRGRGSATAHDLARFVVGADTSVVSVGTTNTGAFLAPVVGLGTVNAPVNVAGNASWVQYTGAFNNPGPTGVTNLGFVATTGTTSGNLLDDIQIELAPFVEFVQPSSATPESASNNLPTLRVDGTVFVPFNVTVNITGGTATLGSDYTTPGNSAVLTVTIPAGTYDGAGADSEFALPITVTQDLLPEANETILLQIQAPPASAPPFLLNSTVTCGGSAQTAWTYTIVDDDARITLTKSAAAPVPVAGQPTQFDMTYTLVANNPSTVLAANYSLVDAPGLDADVAILSAAFALNGGAATPLAGAGPWLLQPQWRALAPGATDTYVLTVRINIARGGSSANDTCASPSVAGSGLHNAATATVQAAAGTNPTFAASACRNTPTPVWATLTKSLAGRVAAADQFQIRMLSAGTAAASATTTGTATTATTGAVVLPAGNTLQFDEALAAGGVPANYVSSIACTNAAAGSGTALPNGAGSDVAGRRQWPAFTPAAGDDIACTITNTPRTSLRLRKALPAGRADPGHQFSLLITGPGGPGQATTTGTGSVANGEALVDPATPGSAYSLSEAPFSMANLNDYAVTWSCTNTRAGGQTPSGSGPAFTITPAAGDGLVCTFANAAIPRADLSITKTNNTAQVVAGATTTYTLVVANAGPAAASGAVLRDPAVPDLQCISVACGSATGGAVCPAVDIATLQGAGVPIPTLPANASLTFTLQCNVQ